MQPPEDEPPSYHASLTTPLLPAFPTNPASSSSSSTSSSRVPPQLEHSQSQTHLPSGFFLLRNRSPRDKGQADSGRTFDVLGRKKEPGSEIGLHPIKKPYLPSSNSLMNQWNNQLLFLGWDGSLCSASAEGRAIDCVGVDGRLMLGASTPIFSVPSRSSHPLPQFRYSPQTSTLHVHFSYDPMFPGPSSSTSWQDDDYVVEAIPMKKQRAEPNFLAGLGEKFGQLGSGLFGKSPVSATFSGGSAPMPSFTRSRSDQDLPPLPVTPTPLWENIRSPNTRTVFAESTEPEISEPSPHNPPSSAPAPTLAQPSTSRDLPPPPPLFNYEEDSPSDLSDSDSDDDSEAMRPLRVIRLPRSWREKFPHEALSQYATSSSYSRGLAPAKSKELRQWRRRQWDIIPVVVRPLETKEPILPLLPINLPFERQITETRNSLLGGGNRVGATPRPLNLAPTALVGGVTVPLQRNGREEEGDDDDDLLVAEQPRSRSGITPATGDSWADAHILPSAEIVKLGQVDQEDVLTKKVERKVVEGVAVEAKGKGKEREREVDTEQLQVVEGEAEDVTIGEKSREIHVEVIEETGAVGEASEVAREEELVRNSEERVAVPA